MRFAILAGLALCILTGQGAEASTGERYPRFLGHRGQIVFLKPERPAKTEILFDLDERSVSLAAFRGKTVVVNFWAPWCPPCLWEMPALDRMASSLDPERFSVVAVAIGGVDPGSARAFAVTLKPVSLIVWRDPTGFTASMTADGARGSAFPLYGLPMTYFIGPGGNVIGYLTGPADWDSDAARMFLERLSRR